MASIAGEWWPPIPQPQSVALSSEWVEIADRHSISDWNGAVDGSGYKTSMDRPDKIHLSLIPSALLEATGRALQHGAKKYADHNWRKGMSWSEVYSALLRHMIAWNEGEDLDKESGLNHIDHAAACIAFLSDYVANPEYAKFDDRFKRPGD